MWKTFPAWIFSLIVPLLERFCFQISTYPLNKFLNFLPFINLCIPYIFFFSWDLSICKKKPPLPVFVYKSFAQGKVITSQLAVVSRTSQFLSLAPLGVFLQNCCSDRLLAFSFSIFQILVLILLMLWVRQEEPVLQDAPSKMEYWRCSSSGGGGVSRSLTSDSLWPLGL